MEGGKKRFDCFAVREYEQNGEKRSAWNRVGVAFENRDGSLSVLLDSLPVDGKLQIREWEPRDKPVGEATRASEAIVTRSNGRSRKAAAPTEEAF